MSKNSDQIESTTHLTETEEAVRAIVDDIRSMASAENASKLFPHGITKVVIELKVAAVELKVEISGPEEGDGPGTDNQFSFLNTKSAKITFNANGEGKLSFGSKSYNCLGSPAHSYPKDLTVTGTLGVDKFRTKYSNEFNVDLEYAILIWGQKGIYVHEGSDNLSDNGGPSQGCVHLAPGHAKEFYDWVDAPTRILISYPWTSPLSLLDINEPLDTSGGQKSVDEIINDDSSDPVAGIVEHRELSSISSTRGIELDDLDLAEYAKSAAVKLKTDYSTVVFTSGRRTVSQQAAAMAGNIVVNRKWIEQTYAASAERNILQKWVDEHPGATTESAIAAGLVGVMSGWSDAQRAKLSRHFAGLAFDVQPTNSTVLKDAIKALPNLVKFLDNEGGITIWHAEFKSS